MATPGVEEADTEPVADDKATEEGKHEDEKRPDTPRAAQPRQIRVIRDLMFAEFYYVCACLKCI